MSAQAGYQSFFMPAYLGVMGMFMAWLTRARDKVTTSSSRTVAHAKPVLMLGLFATGFFLVLAVACAFSFEQTAAGNPPSIWI